MVFFIVFSAYCNGKTGYTMRGSLMLAWYQGAWTPRVLEQSGNLLYLL